MRAGMAIEVFLKRRPQPFDFCLGLDVCHAQVGHCRPQPLVLGAEFLRGMVSASCVIVVGLIGTARLDAEHLGHTNGTYVGQAAHSCRCHFSHARATAPEPGYRSTNSSPGSRLNRPNNQKQNVSGFWPLVCTRPGVLMTARALTQSRHVPFVLGRLRPPRQSTGSHAYATDTPGLNTAHGLTHALTRTSSAPKVAQVFSRKRSVGVLQDSAHP